MNTCKPLKERAVEAGIARLWSSFVLPLFSGTDTEESVRCCPGMFYYRFCGFTGNERIARWEDYTIDEP